MFLRHASMPQMNRHFEQDPAIFEPNQLSTKYINVEKGIIMRKSLTPGGVKCCYLEQDVYQGLKILLG